MSKFICRFVLFVCLSAGTLFAGKNIEQLRLIEQGMQGEEQLASIVQSPLQSFVPKKDILNLRRLVAAILGCKTKTIRLNELPGYESYAALEVDTEMLAKWLLPVAELLDAAIKNLSIQAMISLQCAVESLNTRLEQLVTGCAIEKQEKVEVEKEEKEDEEESESFEDWSDEGDIFVMDEYGGDQEGEIACDIQLPETNDLQHEETDLQQLNLEDLIPGQEPPQFGINFLSFN